MTVSCAKIALKWSVSYKVRFGILRNNSLSIENNDNFFSDPLLNWFFELKNVEKNEFPITLSQLHV